MLNPDYRDILSAFGAEKVEYLLVGAYAMAVHGLPRATGDIDLWIRRSPENARRVMSALRIFGAPLEEISVEDFQQENLVFQIGVVPRRIDILTSLSGVRFDDAWNARLTVDLAGLMIPVINRDLLVQNKRAVGRPKDDLDADWLEGKA